MLFRLSEKKFLPRLYFFLERHASKVPQEFQEQDSEPRRHRRLVPSGDTRLPIPKKFHGVIHFLSMKRIAVLLHLTFPVNIFQILQNDSMDQWKEFYLILSLLLFYFFANDE